MAGELIGERLAGNSEWEGDDGPTNQDSIVAERVRVRVRTGMGAWMGAGAGGEGAGIALGVEDLKNLVSVLRLLVFLDSGMIETCGTLNVTSSSPSSSSSASPSLSPSSSLESPSPKGTKDLGVAGIDSNNGSCFALAYGCARPSNKANAPARLSNR